MQSGFFSEHMKGCERDDASSDKISQANEFLCVLGRLSWAYHIQKMLHILENIMGSCKQVSPSPLLPTVTVLASPCYSGAPVLKSK